MANTFLAIAWTSRDPAVQARRLADRLYVRRSTCALIDREGEAGNKVSGTPKVGNAWWIRLMKSKTLTHTGDKPSEWIAVVPKARQVATSKSQVNRGGLLNAAACYHGRGRPTPAFPLQGNNSS
jgi:hypothetical protein